MITIDFDVFGLLGVRTFCPRPVAKMVLNIGGTSALLGLIAMATDVEGLYAAVKALVCVVRSNKAAQREMDRTKGYQVLLQFLLGSLGLWLSQISFKDSDSSRSPFLSFSPTINPYYESMSPAFLLYSFLRNSKEMIYNG